MFTVTPTSIATAAAAAAAATPAMTAAAAAAAARRLWFEGRDTYFQCESREKKLYGFSRTEIVD